MKRILIDTNVLIRMGERGVDLLSAIDESATYSYTLTILQGTINELEKISRTQMGKEKRVAKLVLQIISAKNITIVPSIGHVDDELVIHSQQGDLVLTQDQHLKRRLTKPYLTLRQDKHVMMVK